MRTGVQWTGTIAANASGRWFTFGWPAAQHVVWHLMPITPRAGAPELEWDVAVERANQNQTTYWITVRNLTPVPVAFEGRYAVMN
jgi:hypothetical protein